ncbi:hypothetical protein PAE9249_04228 [Paenibacillus sp. CECT 9249]|uniref:sugar phosphate isomerase/epimerase family protein n=1 Tax=Paenibacillus sp. CECT 9249 TaxID=2845385 RepID=UPI001E2FB7DE|nr:sugar phosphate isomerase/epimerase family protein [Paenibacillus sp. CECT 9249]CAH0121695.1 hypothetical protein PAE9249_04228 [Paenibacillus sp. CECT 9249]
MKISISNIAWDFNEELDVIGILHEYNIKGVEIAPTKIWEKPLDCPQQDIVNYREFWSRHGIQVVAMQSLLFGRNDLQLFEDEKKREEMKFFLSKMIMLAGRLGIKVLVFGSPKNRSIGSLKLNEALNIAIPFFRHLGEVAWQNGVYFCIEPNPPQYGCDFIMNADEGIALIREVNHPGFGLHLDAAQMTLSEENYFAIIEKSFPYIKHFHISEPYLDLIGSTETNHEEISRCLEMLHYDNWVSIEMKNNVMPSNLDSVKRALEYVSNIY